MTEQHGDVLKERCETTTFVISVRSLLSWAVERNSKAPDYKCKRRKNDKNTAVQSIVFCTVTKYGVS